MKYDRKWDLALSMERTGRNRRPKYDNGYDNTDNRGRYRNERRVKWDALLAESGLNDDDLYTDA